jgi:hypothetical protein
MAFFIVANHHLANHNCQTMTCTLCLLPMIILVHQLGALADETSKAEGPIDRRPSR